jgi:hypothetical protein
MLHPEQLYNMMQSHFKTTRKIALHNISIFFQESKFVGSMPCQPE